MESSLIEKVASGFRRPPRKLPRGYLAFAGSLADRLFPPGWDRKLYEEAVATCSPSLSGAVDCRRSDGGVLGSEIDHAQFLSACYGAMEFSIPMRAELTVVQSAGKPRPLSKPPSEAIVLKPLHAAIYNRISRESWLSRGDVTADSLRRAGFCAPDDSGLLTSGDYKSATDGLSIEVAERLLSVLLRNSVSVPDSVKRTAMESLRVTLFSEVIVKEFEISTGQMMGMFLSFPLLCLQNYVAFRFACLKFGGPSFFRTVPVLINGDDILFRSSGDFSSQWMAWVSSLGLEVELTKTSVARSFGSLNSTLLRYRGGNLLVVPTVRMGMLRATDEPASLGASFHKFVSGLKGDLRFRAGSCFFNWHIGALRGCRWSTYELGFRGLLALRLTVKWGLPISFGPQADPTPVVHSVTFSSENVIFVNPDDVTLEERRLSAREMASWKFSVDWKRDPSRILRYCIKNARPFGGPDFSCLWWPDRPVGWERLSWCGVGELVRRFREPLAGRVDSFPLMRSVYEARDEALPAYDEGVAWVEVAKGGEKKQVAAKGCLSSDEPIWWL